MNTRTLIPFIILLFGFGYVLGFLTAVLIYK